MTKAAALKKWFHNAVPGLKFYPETAVPSKLHGDTEDAAFPYGTYTPSYSAWDDGEASVTVNLWFHGRDEAPANAAAQALSNAIGQSGVTVPCDGGLIWLKRGTPFSQAVQDDDPDIKRRYINITAEYITID